MKGRGTTDNFIPYMYEVNTDRLNMISYIICKKIYYVLSFINTEIVKRSLFKRRPSNFFCMLVAEHLLHVLLREGHEHK